MVKYSLLRGRRDTFHSQEIGEEGKEEVGGNKKIKRGTVSSSGLNI